MKFLDPNYVWIFLKNFIVLKNYMYRHTVELPFLKILNNK